MAVPVAVSILNVYIFLKKVIQSSVRLIWSAEKVKCKANRDNNSAKLTKYASCTSPVAFSKPPEILPVVFRLLRHFVPHTWFNVGSSCISGSGKSWRVVKVVCSELKHFKRFNPC